MEIAIQNVYQAVAFILPVVLVLMVVTNIIVEVLKKLLWEKMPTNVLAFATAVIVTLLAFFAFCSITHTAVVWYMVAGAVITGVFVAYAAMFGYDKLRQTISQIGSIKNQK